MITVAEAEQIILEQCRNFGTELVSFDNCLGRVLAENIVADRDFPPFDRVAMDGIAIKFEAYKNGLRSFTIKATQPAGVPAIETKSNDQCIEIMTGAVMPASVDTVIRYEDLDIKNGIATINTEAVRAAQNVHRKGTDNKLGAVLVEAGQFISPAIISVVATVGKTELLVKKLPNIVIISTGDELVDIHETPADFQIRTSNSYTIKAALKLYGITADMLHLRDEPSTTEQELKRCLGEYNVVILSGGVSMGKYDHVPEALEKLKVKKLFHKVQQKPGKPFWFGVHDKGAVVFAFPGNPVSVFLCLYRYFMPWLKSSMNVETKNSDAVLGEDFNFKPTLQYFLQVKLGMNENGQIVATPAEGNGSGDLANLVQADAFMELPIERTEFKKGEVFKIWVLK